MSCWSHAFSFFVYFTGATVVSWRVNNQEQLFVRWVLLMFNLMFAFVTLIAFRSSLGNILSHFFFSFCILILFFLMFIALRLFRGFFCLFFSCKHISCLNGRKVEAERLLAATNRLWSLVAFFLPFLFFPSRLESHLEVVRFSPGRQIFLSVCLIRADDFYHRLDSTSSIRSQIRLRRFKFTQKPLGLINNSNKKKRKASKITEKCSEKKIQQMNRVAEQKHRQNLSVTFRSTKNEHRFS